MQARKYGTFAGVFTPSILTILGVIMYMRLGWVVGEAGLWGALAIILVAHIISISTGLSIASIATDKKIEAGGIYYILSRSLGLPIGGAIGITLFIGTALSIALYLVGFSENFLGIEAISNITGLDLSIDNIRIVGSIIILVLVAIAFISTSLAIKAQYFILTAILLSLISIGLGFFNLGEYQAESPNMFPLSGHISFELIFAVFFPAVTGFTAGVAMSGDLKDPRKSVPLGTLLAIITGLVIYVGLAIALGMIVDRDILVNDPNFLMRIAWSAPLVVAGIWGATLSSALGGILGGPRILQAMSADGITPGIFSLTQGVNKEPRNALLLTYLIAEAGILIGDLNMIARVVSMFYIAAYGFINLSLALESWASSDFRPSFRIRPIIGIIGFIASIAVMFRIDIMAMTLAIIVISSIYLYLTKKELRLDFGDVWQSVYSSIVRSRLHKMDQRKLEERNWSPNIILFSGGTKSRPYLLDLGKWLVGKHGFLSNFDLFENKEADKLFPKHLQSVQSDESKRFKGIFTRKQSCENIYDGIEQIAQTYGFAGIEPNTIMMGWARDSKEPGRFIQLLRKLESLDINLLLVDYDEKLGYGKKKQIDVWWRGGGQNGNLSLTLTRLLLLDRKWSDAVVRLLIVNPVNHEQDFIKKKAEQILDNMRISAEVKIINNQIEQKVFYDIIRAESLNSDLILLGMPEIPEGGEEEFVLDTSKLCQDIGTVILVKASSTFKDLGIGTIDKDIQEETSEAAAAEEESKQIISVAGFEHIPLLDEQLERFRAQSYQFVNDAMYPIFDEYQQQISLLTDHIKEGIRRIEELEKSKSPTLPKEVIKLQKTIGFRFRKLISDLRDVDQNKNTDKLISQVDSALRSAEQTNIDLPKSLRIELPSAKLLQEASDPLALKFFKARKRLLQKPGQNTYNYHLKIRKLIKSRFPSRQHILYIRLLRALGTHSLRLQVKIREMHQEIYQVLASIQYTFKEAHSEPKSIEKLLLSAKAKIEELSKLTSLAKQTIESQTNDYVLAEANHFSGILNNAAPNHKIVPPKKANREETLRKIPELWQRNQQLLYQASSLDINLIIYTRRVREIIIQARKQIEEYIKIELEGQFKRIEDEQQKIKTLEGSSALEAIRLLDSTLSAQLPLELKPLSILDETEERIRIAAVVFPESISILSEDSYNRFITIQFDEVEKVDISVRKLVDHIIQEEVVHPLSDYRQWITTELRNKWSEMGRIIRMMQFLMDKETSTLSSKEELQSIHTEQETAIRKLTGNTDRLVEQTFYRIEERLNSLGQQFSYTTFINKALNLHQYIKKQERNIWVQRIKTRVLKTRDAAYHQIASLWYRQSKASILADQAESKDYSNYKSDQVLRDALLKIRVKDDIQQELSFYYRQLFQRRNLFITDYFAGREDIIERAGAVIERFRQGKQTSLCITGMPGSGASFAAIAIANKYFAPGKVYQIRPPDGGSADPAIFRRIAQQQINPEINLQSGLNELQDGSVIIIDNLELWWEKYPGGYKVIDIVLKLLEQYRQRFFFIFTCNKLALDILSHTSQLVQKVTSVLECSPLNAEELEAIIRNRHQASGFKIVLKNQSQEYLLPWKNAKIFARLFILSGGNISNSLASWLGMITGVQDEYVEISLTSSPDPDVFDHLKPVEDDAIYQCLIHRKMSKMKLSRISGINQTQSARILQRLESLHILRINSQGYFELEPTIMHLMCKYLQRRSII